ncbi:hypothetical protein WMW72_03480 [Paenibacillus filicis]|uniref:PilZ domain-containing protein n=1 Tax=Paenibacillus filicis TaxID=669464 RepID=A0ABU9DDM7_9BACL
MFKIPDLPAIYGKLSVSCIDHRNVQTRQAVVELTGLDMAEIRFASPLLLPVHRHIVLSFELELLSGTVHFTGILTGQVNRGTAGQQYSAIHAMDHTSRAELMQLIKQRNEYAELQRNKATDSYLAFHQMGTPVSSIDTLV